MPVPLHSGKPLKRETAVVYRGRPLIIDLHPGYIQIREKGRRRSVSLDYRAAFEVAHKIAFNVMQKQKQANRKAGRKR